jgi:putative Holliday junction resolvase
VVTYMRILAIDPGTRRIGLAVSDGLGITAQGLDTFDTSSGTAFLDHVAGLVAELVVGEIVVGHPLESSGAEGPSGRKARELARQLRARIGVDVTLWDERFSSQEAERVLRGSKADKGAVDKIAAILILQSYLDFRRREQ